MRSWRVLPGESQELYSPIGLRLIDEITGASPIGWTAAALDIRDGVTWRATGRKAGSTTRGIVAFSGLGRTGDSSAPTRRYRVRITAEFYRPEYLAIVDALEFDAPSYNDTNPPVPITRLPRDLRLLPATNYPFEPTVSVLRGIVVDQWTAEPLANVQVMVNNLEQVLTDERGLFALPIRFTNFNPQVPVPIDALDQRNNRAGSINVILPDDLRRSQIIPIS